MKFESTLHLDKLTTHLTLIIDYLQHLYIINQSTHRYLYIETRIPVNQEDEKSSTIFLAYKVNQ